MTNIKIKPLIINGESTIQDAMRAIDRNMMPIVLICDSDAKFLGLATEGDIRRAILNGFGLNTEIMRIANTYPTTAPEGSTREELSKLASNKIKYIPIVNQTRQVVDLFVHENRTFIPVATPIIGELEYKYVTEALLSGWVSSTGPFIERFEREFAKFCGAQFAVATSNGTVSLHLALVAAGIEPNDEVIIPALTFAATANAVIYTGAKPVIVDIDPLSWNIDIKNIEQAITAKTKAIIPVHLYGVPCQMEEIMEIAKRRNLIVVEDAAEAHGASYRNQIVGAIGHLASFSFFGNKLLTTGEGGAVVCNSPKLYEKMRVLRDHGMSKSRRYWHEVVGFNYRMTNIQAALGVAQLERWEQIISAKQTIADYYDKHIRLEGFVRQQTPPNSQNVCWIYTLAALNQSNFDRDKTLLRLKERNVDSRPLFNPLPAMPPYHIENWKEKFPVASKVSSCGFSIPSSVELSPSQLEYVANCVVEVCS
jgi:perosamine synthetase